MKTKYNACIALVLFIGCFQGLIIAQSTTLKDAPWIADNGDGTYKNPIVHADYSDPDVIRVGDDYFLVASSFNHVPGIPILHSKDLVNWTIINHVFQKQIPYARYDSVQHGGGAWAPAIRFHDNFYYVYWPDPDLGILMSKTQNPFGVWSEPVIVKYAKGWIDPCPFWDEDGKAYLVNGLAGSRSGMKSTLILSKMSADGTKLLDDGAIIFEGHANHPTIEGPKLYKLNGNYYILAPAGGVGTGWQVALRAKTIYGPYQEKIVLSQGSSPVNGPHQGGLVQTQTGESWFIHFQDKDVYGRILHLQPVTWVDGWPMMGIKENASSKFIPVMKYKKPSTGKTYPIEIPQTSDEFNNDRIGLQWQWEANRQPNFGFPAGSSYGFLRLYNIPKINNSENIWNMPNILAQKFPAPVFTATTKLTFTPRTTDEETGLIITGIDYSYVSIKNTQEGLKVYFTECKDAEHEGKETKSNGETVKSNTIFLRVQVKQPDSTSADFNSFNKAEYSKAGNAICNFSYSENGTDFKPIGSTFAAKKGKWVGAKVGLFATRVGKTYETGYSDFDWFRITK